MLYFVIALILVGLIVPHAFHGTNVSAFCGDIIAVIVLVIIFASCMR